MNFARIESELDQMLVEETEEDRREIINYVFEKIRESELESYNNGLKAQRDPRGKRGTEPLSSRRRKQ